ncbi:MAG TPA: hypothetical protein VF941_03665 [Clostridia bacterium]
MPQYYYPYNYNYPYYTTPWYNPYQYGGYGMQYGYGYPYHHHHGYYRDDSEETEYEDDSRIWGRRPWGWGFGRPWGWGFGRPFFGFGFGSPFFII